MAGRQRKIPLILACGSPPIVHAPPSSATFPADITLIELGEERVCSNALLFCLLSTPFAGPLCSSPAGKKTSLLCRVFEYRSGGLLLSPAPEPSAEVGGIKPQDVTDTHEAAQPRRVVVHDPVFRFAKQAFPALARSGGVPHVFLNPIFHDGPQQMAGWLGADTLGGLS